MNTDQNGPDLFSDTGSVHARRGHPDTSHEAAARLRPDADVAKVVRFMADNDRPQGWTHHELSVAAADLTAMYMRNNGLYKRFSDAKRLGYIAAATTEGGEPVSRHSAYNRRQYAYRITLGGKEWISNKMESAA